MFGRTVIALASIGLGFSLDDHQVIAGVLGALIVWLIFDEEVWDAS